jgi:predicted nucleic acid-binding protein
VKLVLDASVALKWFFQSEEADADTAFGILDALSAGTVQIYEPPHFVAEMAAVLAREKPYAAHEDLADLQALLWEQVEAEDIYDTAMDLSARFQHHLFDTLYHATALSVNDAVLVTADRRYWRNARDVGQIVLLSELELQPGPDRW